MGAWTYLAPKLQELAAARLHVGYVGRPERASPAEGYPAAHAAEQGRIIREALDGTRRPPLPAHHGPGGRREGLSSGVRSAPGAGSGNRVEQPERAIRDGPEGEVAREPARVGLPRERARSRGQAKRGHQPLVEQRPEGRPEAQPRRPAQGAGSAGEAPRTRRRPRSPAPSGWPSPAVRAGPCRARRRRDGRPSPRPRHRRSCPPARRLPRAGPERFSRSYITLVTLPITQVATAPAMAPLITSFRTGTP